MYVTQQLHAPEHIADSVVVQLTIFVVGLHGGKRIFLFFFFLFYFLFPFFLFLVALTDILPPLSTDLEWIIIPWMSKILIVDGHKTYC